MKLGIYIKCKVCNKEFYIEPWFIGKKFFCSRKCVYISFKGQHHSPNTEIKKGEHFSPDTEIKKGDKREKCLAWNGGKIIYNGYIFILKPEHPRSNKKGYVKRADLVMEDILKRPLKQGELVHHINHIKTDDRPKNLKLFSSNSNHIKFHYKTGISFCKNLELLNHRLIHYKHL